MKSLHVEVTFTEPLLGTASANPEAYEEFIASRAPKVENGDEEVGTIPDVDEEIAKTTTIFHRDADGRPFIYDYQVKGFFKDACAMLRRASQRDSGYLSPKLKAYKKEVDGLIFIAERRIPLELPPGTQIDYCQRPLRAQTAQGERVALARSEQAPAGTRLAFTVQCLRDELVDYVIEWLEYGPLRGFGQWRNSGMGRFAATVA